MKANRHEEGALLLIVLVMTAILLVVSAAAMRTVLLSRTANSKAKAELTAQAATIRLNP